MEGPLYAFLIDAICATAGALVLLPLILYLYKPWVARRNMLFGYFSTNSLKLYYEQFYPAKTLTRSTVEKQFREDFNRLYGRRHYVLPIVLLIILTVSVSYAGARTLQVWQNVAPGKFALPWVVASALAGGYAWVIFDLIGRQRRNDFSVGDVYGWVFRILIAAPFGWVFAQLVKPDVGVPLAFLLGAFPTGTLFTFARRLAAERLKVSDDPSSGALELEKLQSITKTNAERFSREGITSVVQLAYADPVDLTIRTNFDFNYVVDCTSQALLWIYFEDKTRLLAEYSLRGAQEVSCFVDLLEKRISSPQATKTLSAVAAALKVDPDALRSTLQQVAGDPYSKFLCSIWH